MKTRLGAVAAMAFALVAQAGHPWRPPFGIERIGSQADGPAIEADATARPERRINPVDLGTILVPHDWLLLAGGQTALIDAAAISRLRDIPNARLRAWFDGGEPVEVRIQFKRNERRTQHLRLPLTATGDSTVLHVSLTDSGHELWRKDIRTMVVAQPPVWPLFGAVETKLRYDAPISVKDPKTGTYSALDYHQGWAPEFNDVVVFLPNGTRFVFWRGSSYAPFWAGLYNTGFSYQWAEIISPPDFVDSVEPLQDKELRHSRVRIMESSPSRVHVRWTYQSVDVNYRSVGEETGEDFYFYPDGFGTRVVTVASTRPQDYTFSEFIVLAPQAAFPLEILPRPTVDLLFPDGGKQRIAFPVKPGSYGPLGRGALTGGAIGDRIYSSPNHLSLMDIEEPEPLSTGTRPMIDALGNARQMTLQTRAWLIAKTAAPDAELLQWAQSFSSAPSLKLRGARLDLPSYTQERRAIRLIAQASSIEIELKPLVRTVNPVFELAGAPKELVSVTVDGKACAAGAYAWDGATLWLKASIDARGATIGLRFVSGDS